MTYKPDYKPIPPIQWSVLTPLYDMSCALFGFGKRFRKKVLNAVPLQDGMTVADVGCATGAFLKVGKETYPRARFIGCDPDRQALAIAARRLKETRLSVELKEAFAESLPLADGTIDVCFSTLAFHHMPDEIKRRAIGEFYRVLKPDGKAVIADFGKGSRRKLWLARFFENMEYLEGNFKGVIPRYLYEAGFKNVRVAETHFPGIDIIVAEKDSHERHSRLPQSPTFDFGS